MALPVTGNLVVHFDANTLSGNSDGTAISLWEDQSPQNYDAHQLTGGNQPLVFNNVINGNTAVQFDKGSSNWMSCVGLSAEMQNTPFEMIIVAMVNESVANNIQFSNNSCAICGL